MRSLNVYVAAVTAIQKIDGYSVIESMARLILRRRGVPEDNLAIVRGENGKPAFRDLAVCFNGSHSGGKAVCVFDDAPVGIDIQKMQVRRGTAFYRKLVKRYFHEKEAERLASLPGDQFMTAFFNLWAQKEAVMKQTGAGFALPLSSFWIDADQTVRRHGEKMPVALTPCEAADGYACWIGTQKNNTLPEETVFAEKVLF